MDINLFIFIIRTTQITYSHKRTQLQIRELDYRIVDKHTCCTWQYF